MFPLLFYHEKGNLFMGMAKTASNSKGKKNKTTKSRPTKKRQGNLIFSLDIGTRTVIGIVAKMVDGVFTIIDHVSIPHTKRAMNDGQIEDIAEVAKVVKQVKNELEARLNVHLSHVCIAAAGRALKTQYVKLDMEVPTSEAITSEIERTIEIEAVSKAQELIDEQQNNNEAVSFYCVGHSVVSYQLDGYSMKSIIGHKGKTVTIEVIAAFLPNIVVEGLYAVTEANKLTVASLTLEPIAAMNVIIPPELRLINIALVDIGAGTSDIAISKNGSIVSYAMATIAGDEITEDIIKRYLVDFDTAEQMKFSSKSETITFRDILGIEHTIQSSDFFKSIYPAVDVLADTIVKNILEVNGESPAAIFLVGGGSQIPDLPKNIAEKLDIPEERVAVGGHNFIKNVVFGGNDITGPEYVTPIGIGVTSTLQSGYDFSTITLNDKKYRVFDTKNMNVLDLLMIAGYKARHIIGHSGKNLSFILNGEPMLFKGEISTPAQLTLNGEPATIETKIKQGDVVKIIPATSGMSAQAKISDIAGDVSPKYVTFDGVKYPIGTTAKVNGETVDSDYQIRNGDDVIITSISKLSELLEKIEFDPAGFKFQKGKAIISPDSFIYDGDEIISVKTAEKKAAEVTLPTPPVVEPIKAEQVAPVLEKAVEVEPVIENTPQPAPIIDTPAPPVKEPDTVSFTSEMKIILNGKEIILPKKDDTSPHVFLEVLNFVSLDLSNPQGNLIMRINGQNASYTSKLSENDKVDIFFE